MKRILLTSFCAAALLLPAIQASALTVSTQTLKNLNAAHAGESNAAHRYQVFAGKAEQEGHPQVAKLFRAAARAEEIHRDRHKAAIEKLGGQLDPVVLEKVQAGSTADNLKAAIAGESYERDTMYPGFIATAKADDARVAVRSLQAALTAEKEHAKFYQQALAELGQNRSADYFVCPTCGYTMARRPGDECPVCREKAGKFMLIR